MAKIYNSEVTKGLAQNAAIQQNVDKVPNELAEKIVPTFETNPVMMIKNNICLRGSVTNGTTTTVYTTPKDKDFYLTGAQLGYIKDATSQATYARISITPRGGAASSYIVLPAMSLTAGSMQSSISSFPLLLERGTTITFNTDSGVANIQIAGIILGYTVDNISA